jgi:hypothetical protein
MYHINMIEGNKGEREMKCDLTTVQAEQLICFHATGEFGRGAHRFMVFHALMKKGYMGYDDEIQILEITDRGRKFALENHNNPKYSGWTKRVGK